MKNVQLFLNYAGHCLAKEHHAIRGGRKEDVQFHALWGLIRHPEKGWILFDTGYTRRFYQATRSFPNKIYALATKVQISESEEVLQQLKHYGVQPTEIEHIILSHFHADHTGGLCDFPKATIYCSRKAFEQVQRTSDLFAFTKGILKQQHPADLAQRVQLIEEVGSPFDDAILGQCFDLFGDKSLVLVPLPGHAAGQIGLRLRTQQQEYFLIADTCWLRRTFQEMVLPHPIVRLFFHSWSDFKNSLKKVNAFHKAHPKVCIVPTHCSTTTAPLIHNHPISDAL